MIKLRKYQLAQLHEDGEITLTKLKTESKLKKTERDKSSLKMHT